MLPSLFALVVEKTGEMRLWRRPRVRRIGVKKDIHPKYVNAKVTCACGNHFETRSTKPAINVEICSSCHPFFTGKQKLIDSEGRVDRFNRKYGRKSS